MCLLVLVVAAAPIGESGGEPPPDRALVRPFLVLAVAYGPARGAGVCVGKRGRNAAWHYYSHRGQAGSQAA